MPHSYNKFNELKRQFLTSHFSKKSRILDVGPGAGKYSDLLPGYSLDCVEVHEPYVARFNLQEKYHQIFICHISDFPLEEYQYDLVIFGDILEHLSIHEAQDILRRVHATGARSFIAVPYLYEQESIDGNYDETHLQPSLTPELMLERYPDIHLFHRDKDYGLYTGPDHWV